MAMLAVGVKGMFDITPGSPVVEGVKRAAAELSVRLGYTGGGTKA
jgi:hypothetical protein